MTKNILTTKSTRIHKFFANTQRGQLRFLLPDSFLPRQYTLPSNFQYSRVHTGNYIWEIVHTLWFILFYLLSISFDLVAPTKHQTIRLTINQLHLYIEYTANVFVYNRVYISVKTLTNFMT